MPVNMDRFRPPEPMNKAEIVDEIEHLEMRRNEMVSELYDIDDRLEDLRSELIS